MLASDPSAYVLDGLTTKNKCVRAIVYLPIAIMVALACGSVTKEALGFRANTKRSVGLLYA